MGSPVSRFVSTLSGAVVFLGVVAAAQSVRVVDPLGAPGSTYINVTHAINLALPGDVVLVKAGTYPGFILDTKDLTIQADTGAQVTITGLTQVRNIPTGKAAAIRGIRFTGSATLDVMSCNGTVWIEDVVVDNRGLGTPGVPYYVPRPIHVSNSKEVVLTNCSFHADDAVSADPYVNPQAGYGGVFSTSGVTAYSCTFEAGDGNDGCATLSCAVPFGYTYGPANGLPGAQIQSCGFVGARCTFIGSDGGNGALVSGVYTQPGANGGDGLIIADIAWAGPSNVHLLDSTMTPGLGGAGTTPGSPGVPVSNLGGAPFTTYPTLSMGFSASSPVREQGVVVLSGDGPPGAPAWVGIGLSPGPLFVPALMTSLAVAPPYLILSVGAFDAAGQLNATPIALGDLPPSSAFTRIYGQPAYLTAGNGIVLGPPTAVLILDSIY